MDEKELRDAYEAGLSRKNNGANEINCNFRHFSSKEKTRAWEFGSEGLPFNVKSIVASAIGLDLDPK